MGVPLGLLLGRTSFPGLTIVRALALLPSSSHPWSRGSGSSPHLDAEGFSEARREPSALELPFTTAGAAVAAAFVSFPFIVLAVEAGLRSLDTRLEDAAASLGASRWYVLRRITIPLLAPQIAAGAVLAWARALGEFGATITFAGNFRAKPTMPLAVFEALESDPGARDDPFAGTGRAVPRRSDRPSRPVRGSGIVSLRAEIATERGPFEVRATIEAEEGETLALLGPNGAGKTTVVLALAGLVEEHGTIELDGVRIDNLPPDGVRSASPSRAVRSSPT